MSKKTDQSQIARQPNPKPVGFRTPSAKLFPPARPGRRTSSGRPINPGAASRGVPNFRNVTDK